MIFRGSRNLAQPIPNEPFSWKGSEEPTPVKEVEVEQQTPQPLELENPTETPQPPVTEKTSKRVRAKLEDGKFRADDKNTVVDEAWVEVEVKTENEP